MKRWKRQLHHRFPTTKHRFIRLIASTIRLNVFIGLPVESTRPFAAFNSARPVFFADSPSSLTFVQESVVPLSKRLAVFLAGPIIKEYSRTTLRVRRNGSGSRRSRESRDQPLRRPMANETRARAAIRSPEDSRGKEEKPGRLGKYG